MYHPIRVGLVAALTTGLVALGARRLFADQAARVAEDDLTTVAVPARVFSETDLDGLPNAAQRYLRHAIAPGTPLVSSCVLTMEGSLAPSPGAAPVSLTAIETLAPRHGFVWTARARMKGVPVLVRDTYHANRGTLGVTALGIVPLSSGKPTPDLTRSARGRLVAEGVWCPTALVHPCVTWTELGVDLVQYAIEVDEAPVSVTLRLAPSGALREVTMERWGNADGGPWRPLPYGFAVAAEKTFGGVTIPSHLAGGWGYGTEGFIPTSAATFTVLDARPAPSP